MNDKKTLIRILLPVLLLAGAAAVLAFRTGPEQSEDAKVYQAAYTLVLQEKWDEAAKSLDAFLAKYPKSGWADDARFWRCHVLEEQGRREEAFRCYQEFLKSYPASEWADDARSNLVNLGRELARTGKPEYKALIKSLGGAEEEDVAIAALYALKDMGDENAVETLVGLYDVKSPARLRERIISVLEDAENPKARAKLMEIARIDPSLDIRQEAIRALDPDSGAEVVKFLKDLVAGAASAEIKEAALSVLADADAPDLAYLKGVALSAKDEDLAREAIQGLGESESPAARAALQEVMR